MLTPGQRNLVIYKANDIKEKFAFKESDGVTAMDLTGWTAESQIRDAKSRDATLIVAFTVTIPTPANGEVFLSLTDTETGNITQEKGFYDILLTDGSAFEQTYVTGKITFKPTVTVKT